jgi:hypothetical protein
VRPEVEQDDESMESIILSLSDAIFSVQKMVTPGGAVVSSSAAKPLSKKKENSLICRLPLTRSTETFPDMNRVSERARVPGCIVETGRFRSIRNLRKASFRSNYWLGND